MIPYNPISLNSMMRPPDAANPQALIEAGQPQDPQAAPAAGLAAGAGNASQPQQRNQPGTQPNSQADYLSFGLAGNMEQSQIDALQEALAQGLAADEDRATKMQEVRSKAPVAPQQTGMSAGPQGSN